MFSTWPEDVVKKVAEESRLQDYNSDEVIVRDSSDLHWIIFISKVNLKALEIIVAFESKRREEESASQETELYVIKNTKTIYKNYDTLVEITHL